MTPMTSSAPSSPAACIFCDIAAGTGEASIVFEDETVVVFMDLFPVTRGHLLVVPRTHVVGLEDTDADTSAHVWAVGHQMARTLRRSPLACEGINMLLCDGEVAFQSVFHLHLHVIPRYRDDGWSLNHVEHERSRALLESDAQQIRGALAAERCRPPSAK